MQPNAWDSDHRKYRIPQVKSCCGCVTDLKTATAIIVVLGIVSIWFLNVLNACF